jgi:hypothetical protein
MESQQLQKPKRKRMTKKEKQSKPYYVEPEAFYNALLKYVEAKKKGEPCDRRTENYIFESIEKIAIGISYMPKFMNYSYKDEMVGDARLKMCAALINGKFKPNKGSPFGYFTTITYHAFINRIKKEKELREGLSNYQELVYNEVINNPRLNSANSDED